MSPNPVRPEVSHFVSSPQQLAVSTRRSLKLCRLYSKQGVHALVNGELDRPVGATPVQALIRVRVRWIAASQCLAPIRTGLGS